MSETSAENGLIVKSLETPSAAATPYDYQTHDIGQGRGVYISTYGCQMNVNDSERMYSLLEMVNFTPVSTPEQASLILINSCSVREKPVHKVYSEVGRYRKLRARNPDLKIGIGGCVAQQEKDTLIKNQPMIDFVFGTDSIDSLPNMAAKAFEGEKKQVAAQFQHRAPYFAETLVRAPGVSTFVNIMKGCDNFCTFCVVPFTRGREKSRPMEHILTDIHALTKTGVKEVTLLGQNVNSYESPALDKVTGQPIPQDQGLLPDFADLLETLARDTSLERIRFTTSHPKDFDQKLVDVMYKYQDKVCEYIHLPFQSGSTRILEMMNRGYTREQYIEKINMIKKAIPNVVLSTDIIVGFPGETEEDFMDTVSLVKELGFETIFAFKYSPRPFTKAARFENQIDEETKSRRLNFLFEEHDAMAIQLVKHYEGKVIKVLVEKYDEKRQALNGRSTQNKLVHFIGDPSLVGQTVEIKITQAMPATFRGELVQPAPTKETLN